MALCCACSDRSGRKRRKLRRGYGDELNPILDSAKVDGYRSGENPARWKGHLEHTLPKRSKVRTVKHHAALPYPEIGAFMAELRKGEDGAARALEFVILTLARTNEAIGALWDEIDFDAKVWTVPGERMKARREHRVPLSAAALAVLKPLHKHRGSEFVFASPRPGRPLSGMAMLMLLRRMGRENITVHGFRSTFKDWASERTSFANELTEMALAHAIRDKTEAAYRRGDLFDKRRALMEAWANFCAAASVTSDVVPIRRRETNSRP